MEDKDKIQYMFYIVLTMIYRKHLDSTKSTECFVYDSLSKTSYKKSNDFWHAIIAFSFLQRLFDLTSSVMVH